MGKNKIIARQGTEQIERKDLVSEALYNYRRREVATGHSQAEGELKMVHRDLPESLPEADMSYRSSSSLLEHVAMLGTCDLQRTES